MTEICCGSIQLSDTVSKRVGKKVLKKVNRKLRLKSPKTCFGRVI